jgi:hypothetical protein
MKTPEELLLEYYTWWLAERDKALQTGVSTDPCCFGLCGGLKLWLIAEGHMGSALAWHPARTAQQDLLTQSAVYHDVDGDYPFNIDDDDYMQEVNSGTCHLNPHRVAYVQRMIKELSP